MIKTDVCDEVTNVDRTWFHGTRVACEIHTLLKALLANWWLAWVLRLRGR
jgi:hypothetical protein